MTAKLQELFGYCRRLALERAVAQESDSRFGGRARRQLVPEPVGSRADDQGVSFGPDRPNERAHFGQRVHRDFSISVEDSVCTDAAGLDLFGLHPEGRLACAGFALALAVTDFRDRALEQLDRALGHRR